MSELGKPIEPGKEEERKRKLIQTYGVGKSNRYIEKNYDGYSELEIKALQEHVLKKSILRETTKLVRDQEKISKAIHDEIAKKRIIAHQAGRFETFDQSANREKQNLRNYHANQLLDHKYSRFSTARAFDRASEKPISKPDKSK